MNTLGDIDKKEKVKLCGYDDYMEFIEAWLQASSDALDLNYSDGQIVVDASELTDNEQHKAASISKDRFHELWVHATSNINDKPGILHYDMSRRGVHDLRRVCVLAPASDKIGNSYLVARFMSDGNDYILIASVSEKDIDSISMEVDENELWHSWAD